MFCLRDNNVYFCITLSILQYFNILECKTGLTKPSVYKQLLSASCLKGPLYTYNHFDVITKYFHIE